MLKEKRLALLAREPSREIQQYWPLSHKIYNAMYLSLTKWHSSPCISAIPLFSIVQVSRHLENSSWTQHLSISWEFSKWNINYNTYILWFVHWYKLSHKRERKYFADLICEGQGAVSFSFDGWNWSISRC